MPSPERGEVSGQMARELGMNPQKLGGKANQRQEPWKMPLPDYIEYLYEKRFGKPRPVAFYPSRIFSSWISRRGPGARSGNAKSLAGPAQES